MTSIPVDQGRLLVIRPMPNARVGFLLPAALGHPRKWSLRRIIEGMLYLLCGGCRGGCYQQISRRLDVLCWFHLCATEGSGTRSAMSSAGIARLPSDEELTASYRLAERHLIRC